MQLRSTGPKAKARCVEVECSLDHELHGVEGAWVATVQAVAAKSIEICGAKCDQF
jgi:hypothetical protein